MRIQGWRKCIEISVWGERSEKNKNFLNGSARVDRIKSEAGQAINKI